MVIFGHKSVCWAGIVGVVPWTDQVYHRFYLTDCLYYYKQLKQSLCFEVNVQFLWLFEFSLLINYIIPSFWLADIRIDGATVRPSDFSQGAKNSRSTFFSDRKLLFVRPSPKNLVRPSSSENLSIEEESDGQHNFLSGKRGRTNTKNS